MNAEQARANLDRRLVRLAEVEKAIGIRSFTGSIVTSGEFDNRMLCGEAANHLKKQGYTVVERGTVWSISW